MNSNVRPAVTTPSAMLASIERRVNWSRRGRTISTSSTAAQSSRSQAAPSAPTWPISPTDAASPVCTLSIEVVAMSRPARAEDRGLRRTFMEPVKTRKPFAST